MDIDTYNFATFLIAFYKSKLTSTARVLIEEEPPV